MAKGSATHGAPAADRPKDLSTGEHAKKGDARRPFRQQHGTTRQSTRQDVASTADTADAQHEPKQGYVGDQREAQVHAPPACAAQRAGTVAPGHTCLSVPAPVGRSLAERRRGGGQQRPVEIRHKGTVDHRGGQIVFSDRLPRSC